MKLNVTFRTLSLFIFALSFSISSLAFQSRFTRMVVFGDSLSDVGTYSPAASYKGGGKFTTNPGKIWVELVAESMGLPMQENRHEGFGIPFKLIGGTNYAQGGARIMGPGTLEPTKFSARSVAEQVGIYLADSKTFTDNDLVFIQGGANDIFQIQKSVDKGLAEDKAVEMIQKAAEDLFGLITQLQAAGAQNIAVQNLPLVDKTPRILGQSASKQAFIHRMQVAFNQRLAEKIADTNVLLLDMNSFDQNFTLNYQNLGFTNVTTPACKPDSLFGELALFCSVKTLVTPGADMTYKFADDVHPSTGFSRLVGDYYWALVRVKYSID